MLYLFIHKTRLGSIIRTVSYDREMLGALGINVQWLYRRSYKHAIRSCPKTEGWNSVSASILGM